MTHLNTSDLQQWHKQRTTVQQTLFYSLLANSNIHCMKSPFFQTIERFSFECRKVIGFAFATLHDWLKKFAPIFHPIKSKTKTNRDSLARVFPRFASATCNYFEF